MRCNHQKNPSRKLFPARQSGISSGISHSTKGRRRCSVSSLMAFLESLQQRSGRKSRNVPIRQHWGTSRISWKKVSFWRKAGRQRAHHMPLLRSIPLENRVECCDFHFHKRLYWVYCNNVYDAVIWMIALSPSLSFHLWLRLQKMKSIHRCLMILVPFLLQENSLHSTFLWRTSAIELLLTAEE